MTPVERMARAIWFRGGEEDDVDWEHLQERFPRECRESAIFALKAIREPSEAMKAAFDRDFDAWHNEKIEDPYHLWKCMIDAALSET